MDKVSVYEFARMDAATALQSRKSNENGLGERESKKRLEEHGRNELAKKKDDSLFSEVWDSVSSPLTLMLLIAAVLAASLGALTDSIIIVLILTLSTVITVYKEHTANEAVKSLKSLVAVTCTVLRNGERKEIPSANVVPGDIVLLSAGDLVPADARVLYANDLFLNQASLTGESFQVEKTAKPIAEQSVSFTELTNIVFSGTNVVTGTGKALVLATGPKTEFGKIAHELNLRPPESAFQRGVKAFSFEILKTTLFIVLLIFLLNYLRHGAFLEAFLFSIAIAVGLTPSLLPIIITVNMASGAKEMAKKGAIVKALSSIPNLGSMDILATDKTGTLTLGKIELVKYVDLSGKDSEQVLQYAYLNSYFQTGIRNTLDDAVLDFRKIDVTGAAKIDEIPFDFVRRRMSVAVSHGGKRLLITKGAPEEVFKTCDNYQSAIGGAIKPLTDANITQDTELFYKLSRDGFRVLAIASKEINDGRTLYTKSDEAGMTLLGFIAFFDPPKATAKVAVKRMRDAGVEIKIITGDNELVATKICSEVGLPLKGILLGQDMDKLTDEALRVRAEHTTIFARVSPAEKSRIIEAMKASGHVVGYLGDGINDAPSLKISDVGISVNNAVDVAKEAADIVLTRTSLSVLLDGILEGRKTFGNTMKYVLMGISSNFGNMFSYTGAVLLTPFQPLLAVQVLFNNLLYDFSQLTISTDTVDTGYLSRPKKWDIEFVKKYMITFGLVSSVFDFITFGALLFVFNAGAATFQTGWFLESLATQVLVVHVIRTRKTPFLESTASPLLLLASAAVIIIGWITPYSPWAGLFNFIPLPVPLLLVIGGITLAYLAVTEMVKRRFYKQNPN
ncbi:magnesium-translocating P-type ATPase [Candidatus Micrarchaeota archaeon]|nr:magnesium-translocating P-type ATPase [Candidatus Micrarchaeota archaeon]